MLPGKGQYSVGAQALPFFLCLWWQRQTHTATIHHLYFVVPEGNSVLPCCSVCVLMDADYSGKLCVWQCDMKTAWSSGLSTRSSGRSACVCVCMCERKNWFLIRNMLYCKDAVSVIEGIASFLWQFNDLILFHKRVKFIEGYTYIEYIIV